MLGADLGPSPRPRTSRQSHCGAGVVVVRKAASKRGAESDPGDPEVDAVKGAQPSWPLTPPTAAPAQTLDCCSSWSPPPSFGSQLPGPGILRLRAPRIPRWFTAPKPWPGGRIPSSQNAQASPPPQPDPRALPRILGLCPLPSPSPTPATRGRAGVSGPEQPASLTHCSRAAVSALRATPQEPRRPQLTTLGSGKGGRQNPAPGDLTP